MEKIAIIDLGSNSARLVIVDILDGGYFTVHDEIKEAVRLGQDMETDGFLKPARVAQTIQTLKMFRRVADSYKVEKILAYATSAVRQAKNQKSFIDEVAVSCGIKLKVLSQEEEAMLVYQGVINSMDIPKGLIIEIGGGSTKLIHYNRRTLINQETIPYGAVNLTDLFKNEAWSPEEKAEEIEKFMLEKIQEIPWLNSVEPEVQLIGVGGSLRNLGKISRMMRKYPLDMAHNYNIPVNQFNTVYDTIKTLPLDRTMKIKGLSSGRADIFPSALAIVKALVTKMNFTNIVISGSGLREGAMFRYAVPSVNEKPISDVLGYSLATWVTHLELNTQHCTQVFNLCTMLYKQLKVLHKLPRPYAKVLRVASILHDSGMRLKYYGHNKHSEYVILNSNLFGISHKDIVMAALVAGQHKKDETECDYTPYKYMLTEEDVDAVKKLSVILRIAESFDRSLCGIITNINCDVLGDSVIMKIESNGNDCQLEIKEALTVSQDFKRSFRKNLEIIGG